MRRQTKNTNLIVGVALIIVGCLDFIGPVLLQGGCGPGPGSLIVQGGCNDLATPRLFAGWFLGASSFGLAAVIVLAGRTRMGLRQFLNVAAIAYGGLPFALFLTMVFTNLPGSPYLFQVMVAYYLLAVCAGLVTIFGRAGAVSQPSTKS